MGLFTFYCGCEQLYISIIKFIIISLGIISTALLLYLLTKTKCFNT